MDKRWQGSDSLVPLPPADTIKDRWKRSTYRSLHLTMRDGVKIAVDVLLPSDKDFDLTKGIPTLFHQTRYHRHWMLRAPLSLLLAGGKPFDPLNFIAKRGFLASGFAIVSIDVRGTGASYGRWKHAWQSDEREDSKEVLDWIVRQPWSNGKVVLYGVSYDATAALFTGGLAHPSVVGIMTRYPFWNVAQDIGLHNGVPQQAFFKEWVAFNRALDANNLKAFPGAGGLALPLFARGVAAVTSEDEAGDVEEASAWEAEAEVVELENAPAGAGKAVPGAGTGEADKNGSVNPRQVRVAFREDAEVGPEVVPGNGAAGGAKTAEGEDEAEEAGRRRPAASESSVHDEGLASAIRVDSQSPPPNLKPRGEGTVGVGPSPALPPGAAEGAGAGGAANVPTRSKSGRPRPASAKEFRLRVAEAVAAHDSWDLLGDLNVVRFIDQIAPSAGARLLELTCAAHREGLVRSGAALYIESGWLDQTAHGSLALYYHVCQAARQAGGPTPPHQLLIGPWSHAGFYSTPRGFHAKHGFTRFPHLASCVTFALKALAPEFHPTPAAAASASVSDSSKMQRSWSKAFKSTISSLRGRNGTKEKEKAGDSQVGGASATLDSAGGTLRSGETDTPGSALATGATGTALGSESTGGAAATSSSAHAAAAESNGEGNGASSGVATQGSGPESSGEQGPGSSEEGGAEAAAKEALSPSPAACHAYVMGEKPGWYHFDTWPPPKSSTRVLFLGEPDPRPLRLVPALGRTCSAVFTCMVGPHARQRIGLLDSASSLDGRRRIDVPRYPRRQLRGVSRYIAMTMPFLPVQYKGFEKNRVGHVTWTSAPLEADVSIVGAPQLEVLVGAPRGDTDVFVYLLDVSASGGVEYVTEGFARASHRLEYFRPSSSTATPPGADPSPQSESDNGLADNGLLRYDNDPRRYSVLPDDPYHTHREGDWRPLPDNGDVPGSMRFALLPTAYTFKRGHRIRISVVGTDLRHLVDDADLPGEGRRDAAGNGSKGNGGKKLMAKDKVFWVYTGAPAAAKTSVDGKKRASEGREADRRSKGSPAPTSAAVAAGAAVAGPHAYCLSGASNGSVEEDAREPTLRHGVSCLVLPVVDVDK